HNPAGSQCDEAHRQSGFLRETCIHCPCRDQHIHAQEGSPAEPVEGRDKGRDTSILESESARADLLVLLAWRDYFGPPACLRGTESRLLIAMNPEHIHLFLNHLPTIGFGIGLAVFVFALLFKQVEVERAALVILFLTAALTISTYVSGNDAREALKETP